MFEDRAGESDSSTSSSATTSTSAGKSTLTGKLQLKAAGGGGGRTIATAETGFGGDAMPLPYRSEMESGFGVSFAGVQAYGGADAQAANAAMGSRAYAVGSQIAFDTDAPAKEVVAHELAHTIQQSGGGSSSTAALQTWTLGGGDPFEAEADAAASSIMAGQPATVGLRAPTGIATWGGEDHYTIGNLAGNKAMTALAGMGISTPTAPTILQATPDATTASQGGASNPASQGIAGSGTGINHSAGGTSLGIETSGGGTISFGAASRYSGDYATTVNGVGGLAGRTDELSGAGAARRSGDTAGNQALNGIQFAQMSIGGTTNSNHFYPVNRMEYANHHNLAMGHARQAWALSQAGDEPAAAGEIREAMQEEGFASHFLQDTFSAGHMAPRSLDSTEHLAQDPDALHLAMANTGAAVDQAVGGAAESVGSVVGNVTGFFSGAWDTVSSFTNPFSEEGRAHIANEMQTQAQNTATTWGHSATQASNAVTGTFQQGGLVNQATRTLQQLPGTLDDAKQGLLRTKQWHDFFCALPNGIPTDRGNFHGDYLMDGNDLGVVSDTASNSIIAVLSAAHGKATSPAVAVPTPNISAILADPMAGPAWRMMMSDYEASLAQARTALAASPDATHTTDGGTTVSSAEILRLIDANIMNGESGARVSPAESRSAAQAAAQIDPDGNLPRQRQLVLGSLDGIEHFLMTEFAANRNLGVDDNLNAPVTTDPLTGASTEPAGTATDLVSDGLTGPAFDPCQLEGRYRMVTTLLQQIADYQGGLEGARGNATFSQSYTAVINSEMASCTTLHASATAWKARLDALTAAGSLNGGGAGVVGLIGELGNNAAWGAGHPEWISNHLERRAYRQEMQGQTRTYREQLRANPPSWGAGATGANGTAQPIPAAGT